MRIAEDSASQQLHVAPDLRVAVKPATGIVQIDMVHLIETGEISLAEARKTQPRKAPPVVLAVVLYMVLFPEFMYVEIIPSLNVL